MYFITNGEVEEKVFVEGVEQAARKSPSGSNSDDEEGPDCMFTKLLAGEYFGEAAIVDKSKFRQSSTRGTVAPLVSVFLGGLIMCFSHYMVLAGPCWPRGNREGSSLQP